MNKLSDQVRLLEETLETMREAYANAVMNTVPRPIQTAPRDVRILVFHVPSRVWTEGYFEGSFVKTHSDWIESKFSHWMPQPSPP